MALLVGFVLDQQITVQKAFEFVFRFNRRRSRSRGMASTACSSSRSRTTPPWRFRVDEAAGVAVGARG